MAAYDPCATYTSLQTALRNSKPMARYSVLPPSFPLPPPPPRPSPPTNQHLPPCTLQSLPITNTNSNVFDWRCPVKTGGTIAWTNCVRQSITRLDACKISSVRMAIGSQKSSDKDSDDEQGNLSAFLGPNLWEKSYGTDFKLEYMDLDEFLVENGIPTDPMGDDPDADSTSSLEVKSSLINSAPTSPASEDIFSDNDSSISGKPSMDATSDLLDESEKMYLPEDEDEEDEDEEDEDEDLEYSYQAAPKRPGTSRIPGEKGFDPAKRKFTKEELKPQPLIKKSRKIFVPDNHKDDKYWARRKKNNVAAKRSRDARRVKENQIALRANFLENENNGLKAKLEKALQELTIIKTEKESLASENLYLQKQLKKYTR